MFKSITSKSIISKSRLIVFTLFIFMFLPFSSGFSQIYQGSNRPMPITLVNPLSFNGTYEIDRIILRDGDTLLLDSDNNYEIYEHKGVATINIKISKDLLEVDLIYKIQMIGPAFRKKEISLYSFVYDEQTFTAQRLEGTPFSKALSSIGMTVYDSEDLIWTIPFEKGYSLILKLEKKSDITTIIDKTPFLNVTN